MKYRTCVSIAEKSPNRLKQILKKSLKKSDYAEIRFDFLKPEQVPDALEKVKKELKRVVCTLRPKSEGGVFSGTEKERIAILKLISEYNPFLIDVEYRTISKNKDLARYIKQSKTDVLVSWHDFKKTPNLKVLEKQLSKMKKISSNVKIVTMAKKTDDSTTVLQLYNKKGQTNLIGFSMGDAGRISRILCLHLGSPFTYVSIGVPIAPGQFSVDEVKRMSKI